MSADKVLPFKRAERPTGRDLPRENVLRHAWGLAASPYTYALCDDLDHRPDPTDPNVVGARQPGRPPELPPEAYVVFMGVWARLLSDRETEQLLVDPIVWNPIRRELHARFPQYPRLQPGGRGPTRSMFWRWYDRIADEKLDEFRAHFEAVAASQARDMGMYDPDRGAVTHPDIADQFIGDGTWGRAMFNATEGDFQLNRATGEIEQKPYDPDGRRQHYKSDEEIVTTNSIGVPHGLLHGTTGHVDEMILLSTFHIGPGQNEADLGMDTVIRLKQELLPGAQGAMWDKVMRGVHIDRGYDAGLQTHAKVALIDGKPKETLIEHAAVKIGGREIGKLPLVAVGGAAHVRVQVGLTEQYVRLEPAKTEPRAQRRTHTYRWNKVYRVPDDPRIPARYRGGHIRVRLDTTDDDREDGLKRAENLRPIAEGDTDWDVVGGPRSRAEGVNSLLKRKWPNKRIPAVGARRQQMRILAFGIALNHMSAVAYERRTGHSILGPPATPAAA